MARRAPAPTIELPADAVVHSKIVVTRASGKQILAGLRSAKPARALRALLARRGAEASTGPRR